MALGQELRDFTSAFSTGFQMAKSRDEIAAEKLKAEDAHNTAVQGLEDSKSLNQYRIDNLAWDKTHAGINAGLDAERLRIADDRVAAADARSRQTAQDKLAKKTAEAAEANSAVDRQSEAAEETRKALEDGEEPATDPATTNSITQPKIDPGVKPISYTEEEPATGRFDWNTYVRSTAMKESGGNLRADNPDSSAFGLFQPLKGTWNAYRTNHPELGLTPGGRSDPRQQMRFMKAYTRDSIKTLRSAGIPVTNGTVYAAHLLGPAGAKNVFRHSANTPMSRVVDRASLRSNPFLNKMTVGQFYRWSENHANRYRRRSKPRQENQQVEAAHGGVIEAIPSFASGGFVGGFAEGMKTGYDFMDDDDDKKKKDDDTDEDGINIFKNDDFVDDFDDKPTQKFLAGGLARGALPEDDEEDDDIVPVPYNMEPVGVVPVEGDEEPVEGDLLAGNPEEAEAEPVEGEPVPHEPDDESVGLIQEKMKQYDDRGWLEDPNQPAANPDVATANPDVVAAPEGQDDSLATPLVEEPSATPAEKAIDDGTPDTSQSITTNPPQTVVLEPKTKDGKTTVNGIDLTDVSDDPDFQAGVQISKEVLKATNKGVNTEHSLDTPISNEETEKAQANYLKGYGATTEQAMQHMRDIIDPQRNKYSPDQLDSAVMGAMYKDLRRQGKDKEAVALVQGFNQYNRARFNGNLSITKAMILSGNLPKALAQATMTFSGIPNGVNAKFSMAPDGKHILIQATDEKTKKPISKQIVSPEEFMAKAMGFSSIDYDNAMRYAADEKPERIDRATPEQMDATRDQLDSDTTTYSEHPMNDVYLTPGTKTGKGENERTWDEGSIEQIRKTKKSFLANDETKNWINEMGAQVKEVNRSMSDKQARELADPYFGDPTTYNLGTKDRGIPDTVYGHPNLVEVTKGGRINPDTGEVEGETRFRMEKDDWRQLVDKLSSYNTELKKNLKTYDDTTAETKAKKDQIAAEEKENKEIDERVAKDSGVNPADASIFQRSQVRDRQRREGMTNPVPDDIQQQQDKMIPLVAIPDGTVPSLPTDTSRKTNPVPESIQNVQREAGAREETARDRAVLERGIEKRRALEKAKAAQAAQDAKEAEAARNARPLSPVPGDIQQQQAKMGAIADDAEQDAMAQRIEDQQKRIKSGQQDPDEVTAVPDDTVPSLTDDAPADDTTPQDDYVPSDADVPGDIEGLLERGNLDLENRPVVDLEDGTKATLLSMSFSNDEGLEILIPKISKDGKVMTDQEAMEQYKMTGEHLGKFDSVEAANSYAERLHKAQEAFYELAGKSSEANTALPEDDGGETIKALLNVRSELAKNPDVNAKKLATLDERLAEMGYKDE